MTGQTLNAVEAMSVTEPRDPLAILSSAPQPD